MRSLLLGLLALLAGFELVRGSACNNNTNWKSAEFDYRGDTLESGLKCLMQLGKVLLEMQFEFPMVCCELELAKPLCTGDEKRMNALAQRSFKRYAKRQRKLVSRKLVSDKCAKAAAECCKTQEIFPPGFHSMNGHEKNISARALRLGLDGVGDFFKQSIMCIESLAIHIVQGRFLETPDICCGLPVVDLFCNKPKPPTRKPT